MQVYKVEFELVGDVDVHTTYIHAVDVKQALVKLSDRFPREPKTIHVVSVTEDSGKFIIGSEEQDFSGAS